jgi:HlyD family secretion protein
MDSTLFAKKAISLVEFETSKNTLLQAEQSYQSALSAVQNTQISIIQLQQNILDLLQQADEQDKELRLSLSGAYDNLQAQINQWEQTYVFKSPIDGKITLTKFWQKNQNISAGEILLSVVPESETKIMGKLSLPLQGAGKVKTGQTVNIKFDGFPYMEYGMVKGRVKNISLVPITSENVKYIVVEVSLPDDLITTYGKPLAFSQEMTGTAEIITEDTRLLSRFINPIKSLIFK